MCDALIHCIYVGHVFVYLYLFDIYLVAYRQRIASVILVKFTQVMTSHRHGAKPLPKSMLTLWSVNKYG